MPREHEYFTYILASRSRTLYVGITNSLMRRMREHREGTADSFTAKFRIHRLVYFERFQYVGNAIAREKVLKHCLREEKIALIVANNSTWEDLAADFFRRFQVQKQVLRFAKDDKLWWDGWVVIKWS